MKFLRFVLWWLCYALVIVAIGATIGVTLHVIYALVWKDGLELADYALLGLKHGSLYGGVWAGGGGLVLSVMRARREYIAKTQYQK